MSLRCWPFEFLRIPCDRSKASSNARLAYWPHNPVGTLQLGQYVGGFSCSDVVVIAAHRAYGRQIGGDTCYNLD